MKPNRAQQSLGNLYAKTNNRQIQGLDPARPLINEYASHVTRLSPEDAFQVQVIHTNAGFLGEAHQRGHVDFCVNGGNSQPGCKGHWLRKSCDLCLVLLFIKRTRLSVVANANGRELFQVSRDAATFRASASTRRPCGAPTRTWAGRAPPLVPNRARTGA